MRFTIEHLPAVEEIDAQEFSGDEFDVEECPLDPIGHLFKTHCGETKCVRCGRIAWG